MNDTCLKIVKMISIVYITFIAYYTETLNLCKRKYFTNGQNLGPST